MQYLAQHRSRAQHTQAGFTVLELMVATTIFAIVLLVLTVGVLSFSRDYFASVTRSNTQTVARGIIEDVARAIQFGAAAPVPGTTTGNTKAWCIDNVQYLYANGYEVADTTVLAAHKSKYGLIKRVATGCGGVDITSGSYNLVANQDKELLAKNMRLSVLEITQQAGGVYTVHVRVVYGDDDMLNNITPADWSKLICKGDTGSQFCAVSDLTTTVQRRIQ